eukprot:Skav207650  [mRNA]  locus=scaffold2758:77333:83766:+ [translate_table: standard]
MALSRLERKGADLGLSSHDGKDALTMGRPISDLAWVAGSDLAGMAVAAADERFEQNRWLEYEAYDSRWQPQGRGAVQLDLWKDKSRGLFTGRHGPSSDGYYDYYIQHQMGPENGLYHICEGEASRCRVRKNRGDRRELIHVDKWRLLTPMSMLNISYLSSLGAKEGEKALGEKARELKQPVAPAVGSGLDVALQKAGAPAPVEPAEAPARAAPERAKRHQRSRSPVRRKDFPQLLVEKAAKSASDREKAQKDREKKKKKKKRRRKGGSHEGGSEESSSDALSSSESSVFGAAPARGGPQLWKISQKKPGQLTKRALDGMSRYLASRAEEGSVEAKWQGQQVLAYLNQILFASHPPKVMGVRMARELVTLAMSLDFLMSGELARASDLLVQRFKACETSLQDNGWTMAKHLEIIPPQAFGLAEEEERELAARRELRSAREPASSESSSRAPRARRKEEESPQREAQEGRHPGRQLQRGPDPAAASRGSGEEGGTETRQPGRKRDNPPGRKPSREQPPKRKKVELLEGPQRKGGRKGKAQGKGQGPRMAKGEIPRGDPKRSAAQVSSKKIAELMSWLRENEPKHLSAAQVGTHLVLQAVTLNGTLGQIIEMSLAPTWVEGERRRNLFPLPLWPDVRDELEEVIEKMRFKDEPGEWRARAETKAKANRALRKQGLLVWHGLVVNALNWLHADGKPAKGVGPPGGQATQAQEEALLRIWEMVKVYVNEKPDQGGVPRTPETPWAGELSKLRVSYTGEVVEKARPLTLEQVLPGLPSPAHGGLVNILEVVDEKLARKLERPDLLLRECIPELVPEPQVMCGDIEWGKVAKAMYDRNLVTPVDQYPVIDGKPVLNGAFGVVKPEKFTEQGEPVLRMIIDLRATNAILEQLEGDVHTLTGSCAFQKLVVDYEDDLLISGDDLTAAFYLFKLPPSWPQFLVLRKPIPWDLLEPGKAGETFLGLSVLPMGWNSAVAVMQNAHRQIALRSEASLGAGLMEKAEVRKDAEFPEIDDGPIWQVYLDDTTIVEKIDKAISASLEGKPPEEQQRLRRAYAWWGIPTNAAKALERCRKAERLGAVLDGEQGVLRGSTKRGLELMSLGAHLRTEGAFNKKGLQVYAGKAVHLLQFRRPLFSVLQEVFVAIVQTTEMVELSPSVADEMMVLEALLPSMMCNLKAPVDPVVTASDACESGGGACFASRLSRLGEEELLKKMEEPIPEKQLPSLDFREGQEKIVVIDLFAGIGGLERALKLAGVSPWFSVAVEKDPDCRRCLRRNFPGMEFWTDITTVTKEKVKSWLKRIPDATGVITGMGSPCQGLSSLSVDRKHLEDPRSKLFYAGAEVIRMVKEVAEEEGMWSLNLVENVVPDDTDIREMSRVLGHWPVMIEAGLLSRVRRPRLYWVDVDLADMEEVERYRTESFTVLEYGSVFEENEVFLEPDHTWEASADPAVRFPTFTRSIPRKAPPKAPAGLRNTPPDAEVRWREDQYRYPPYTYRAEYMVKAPGGELQPLQARERERLMGFLPDHTLQMVRSLPKTPEEVRAAEDLRCAAIGNSFHTVAVASLLDHAMWSLGVKDLKGHHLIREQCSEEIMEANKKTQAEGAPPLKDETEPPQEGGEPDPEGFDSDTTCVQVEKFENLQVQAPKVVAGPVAGMAAQEAVRSSLLVAAYVKRQEYRGSDVRLDTGTLYRPEAFPRATINPHKWEWHVAHSYAFQKEEHINVLELRALNHTMEWRLRRSTFGNCRAMHLCDSQVVLGVVVKGRSSSRQLNRLLRRLAALLVAGGGGVVVGWVESHLNPADEPSRRHEPKAKTGQCFIWKQVRMGWLLVLGFAGFLRTSELIQLKRKDVMLPRPGQPQEAVLFLEATKTTKRNFLPLDKVVIEEKIALQALKWLVQGLQPGDTLSQQSNYAFRKLWKEVLTQLKIQDCGYMPYSLRRGAATSANQQGVPLDLLVTKGRWQHIPTARIYLDQGLQSLGQLSLPPASRAPLAKAKAKFIAVSQQGTRGT